MSYSESVNPFFEYLNISANVYVLLDCYKRLLKKR